MRYSIYKWIDRQTDKESKKLNIFTYLLIITFLFSLIRRPPTIIIAK